MSEKILMPLDGSKLGEAALSYIDGLIARLAPGETVEIILFRVITTLRHKIPYQGGGMVTVPYTDEEISEFKDKAKEYLEKASKRLQSEKITLTFEVDINENPAEAIIEAEKKFGPDLVAMSTHGRGGISRFTMGSVADKVMRGGGVPVLMVRAEEE